ncbi:MULTISPECIES: Crp/Fnr family transcriptional regulator [Flavobacterium]|uniref:Crp/Fnr family transcriptional regulator n=1 Tax=Flavobacterium TaxID=237 RepID=UPI000E6CAF8C|nr:Crp/Fnr family transcriptional regulator [Flavobacterium anhuiense]
MSKTILHAINELISLTDVESDKVLSSFEDYSLSKKEYWLQEGKRCQHIAFVKSGKMRMFYHDNEGNEVTCFFIGAGTFITSYGSFLTNHPAYENIIAIEDTELLIIEKTALEKLSESIPKIHILRRIIAEHFFLVLENRIRMMQSQNAEERYELFAKEHPELLTTIPLHHIASFLGITPQHLSRLRKK